MISYGRQTAIWLILGIEWRLKWDRDFLDDKTTAPGSYRGIRGYPRLWGGGRDSVSVIVYILLFWKKGIYENVHNINWPATSMGGGRNTHCMLSAPLSYTTVSSPCGLVSQCHVGHHLSICCAIRALTQIDQDSRGGWAVHCQVIGGRPSVAWISRRTAALDILTDNSVYPIRDQPRPYPPPHPTPPSSLTCLYVPGSIRRSNDVARLCLRVRFDHA